MTTPRIFVSHSHHDDDFGARLVQDLRSELGSEDAVWYDSRGGLHGGDAWWQKIVRELPTHNTFIVVLSPDSMASPWVNDEIDLAWQQKNSPARMHIIPVLYRPCEVRGDLQSLHIIRFLSPKTYERAFEELRVALGLSTGIQSPQPPARREPAKPGLRVQRSPSVFASLLLLTLILLGGGGFGIYGAATGRWPWRPSTSNLPSTTAQTKATSTAPASITVAGQTWHVQRSGTSQGLDGVVWSGSLFVVAGYNGTILTSPDGRTWTAQNSGTTEYFWNIA